MPNNLNEIYTFMNSTAGSAVEDRKKGVLTIAQLIKEAEDKKRQVSFLHLFPAQLVLSYFLVLGLMFMII